MSCKKCGDATLEFFNMCNNCYEKDKMCMRCLDKSKSLVKEQFVCAECLDILRKSA